MCCEGWRLFWRPINLVCLNLVFCCFLIPYTELFRYTLYYYLLNDVFSVTCHPYVYFCPLFPPSTAIHDSLWQLMPYVETIRLCLLFLFPVHFRFTQEHWFRSEEIYRVIRNECRSFNNLPPLSPDATPNDFFLWGLRQGSGLCSSSSRQVSVRIRTAIETITADMLRTVWNELDYRVDVCRITKGAHIEHL